MSDEAMGPYERAAWTYRRAGWAGVLPLPPGRKGPPPSGFTGWAGVDPSGPDVQTWLDEGRGAGNIGLHLPAGVYGLDVDNYDAKTGGAALAQLVERLGPLPATWTVSSRDDGVSGIRFFRAWLPPGRVWLDEPGGHQAGIESVHKGHRYAVAWPSVHPDTGRVYTWRHESGYVLGDGEVPRLDALPAMPEAWGEALSRPGEVRSGTQAGHDETVTAVTAWRDGEPCERVMRAAERARAGLAAAVAGAALHTASEATTWELACLGHEGHAGVRRALAEHYAGHVEARVARDGEAARRDGDGEWWRLVRGAVGKLVPSAYRERCDCDAWSGAGVTFTPDDLGVAYEPAPAPDQFDAPAGQPGQLPGHVSGDDDERRARLDAMRALLLTPSQVRELRAPRPLVRGVLRMNTLAWLIAAPGSFKSFVALDLAARVVAGLDWAGRPIRTPGPVLYIAAEGADGMTGRVTAWEKIHGPMHDDVHVLPRPVQASNATAWGNLVELAADLRPVLVIIDTQARVSTGIKENDNTEMGGLVERFDELRRATRACVLVVHHTGRAGAHARGGSVIDGAQDTELRIERTGGPKSLTAEIMIDKQKDGPDTDRIKVEMTALDLGLDEWGDPMSSLVATCCAAEAFAPNIEYQELPEDQARILAVLRDQFDELGATKSDLERAWTALTPARGTKPDSVKRRFNRALNAVAKADRIAKVHGTQRYIAVNIDDGLRTSQDPDIVRDGIDVHRVRNQSFSS
jgi:hypothetical protein